MALLSGISEAKILEVKQTEIHEKASQSIKSKGWLPNLFRGIVAKAKDFLQNLIREKDMPPKPTLDIDMAEFRHMRNLMIKVQDKAREIKNLQDKVLPQLKQQLADTKGLNSWHIISSPPIIIFIFIKLFCFFQYPQCVT